MAPIMMEVIEWFGQTGAGIAHAYPEAGGGDMKRGAQLIVRENQAAVFFRDGQGLDVFGPGRHTLSTQNLPILTRLLSLPWGFTSPFRAEVYFVNLKGFTNMRWGTRDPVAFKDTQLGLIRLRAFGNFTMRVTQPLLFVNSLVGTQGSYTTDQIEEYLRDVIVARCPPTPTPPRAAAASWPRPRDARAASPSCRAAPASARRAVRPSPVADAGPAGHEPARRLDGVPHLQSPPRLLRGVQRDPLPELRLSPPGHRTQAGAELLGEAPGPGRGGGRRRPHRTARGARRALPALLRALLPADRPRLPVAGRPTQTRAGERRV